MKSHLKINNITIRRKLFIAMLILSVLPVAVVTFFSMQTIYNTMYRQIIDSRRMSINWLQDRLELSIEKYISQFYEFEVNKQFKNDILTWCGTDEGLDYAAKLRFISLLNSSISIDGSINSIELYNLATNEVLVAQRSGAKLLKSENSYPVWSKRSPDRQSNIIFMRDGNEILILHRINLFETNTPLAMMIVRVKPSAFESILSNIKATADESIILLNDEDKLITTDTGLGTTPPEDTAMEHLKELQTSKGNETLIDNHFYFYQSVNGGKLQVIQIVPMTIITRAVGQTLLIGILVAILTILTAVVLSALLSRIISEPIVQLSNKMRHITLKDAEAAEYTPRADEIGQLQDSFNVMISRNQELITREYQSKIEKREAQLRALQAQINPHFMYNTLQVIGGMALKKQAPEIYTVTTALSDIMRYSLNFSREMVLLHEEIKYLNSYLMIQNRRFDDRMDIDIRIEKTLMNYLVPKLILQPILENSFEHGLANKSGGWKLGLNAELDAQGDLRITVSDNGLGIPEDRLAAINASFLSDTDNAMGLASHIGLKNVNARIRLKFGNQYGISVASTEGEGTVVTVRMKAEKEDHDELSGNNY